MRATVTADRGAGEAHDMDTGAPTTNKATRRTYERAALEELALELTRQGRPATVTGWPEDDGPRADGLTVDALYEMAGRTWAVEHTRVTFGEKVEPHRQEAERELRAPLTALARDHDRSLLVLVERPAGDARARQAYFASVCALAEAALQDPSGSASSGGSRVLALPPTGEEQVQILTTMAATANIQDQVRDALVDSLSAKLTKQLARANDLGFPVLLLLDQMEPPGDTTPAQWLAAPATVEAATAPMFDAHPGVVNELWLRDPRGAFHALSTRSPAS
jgi:hypothetical protein